MFQIRSIGRIHLKYIGSMENPLLLETSNYDRSHCHSITAVTSYADVLNGPTTSEGKVNGIMPFKSMWQSIVALIFARFCCVRIVNVYEEKPSEA